MGLIIFPSRRLTAATILHPVSPARMTFVQAEWYTPTDRIEQPTLAQMTEAALRVMAAKPDQPFALFIEAGDVDFALHANNLDNAIGAIYSGEDAVRVGDPMG